MWYDDNFGWFGLGLGLCYFFSILICVAKLIRIKGPVLNNITGAILGVCYILSFNFFIMFLCGRLWRPFSVIVCIQLFVLFGASILIVALDSYSLKSIVFYLLYFAILTLAVLGCFFIDYKAWPGILLITALSIASFFCMMFET